MKYMGWNLDGAGGPGSNPVSTSGKMIKINVIKRHGEAFHPSQLVLQDKLVPLFGLWRI